MLAVLMAGGRAVLGLGVVVMCVMEDERRLHSGLLGRAVPGLVAVVMVV